MSNSKGMRLAAKRIFILAAVIAVAFVITGVWFFVLAPMAKQKPAVLYVTPKDEFASGFSEEVLNKMSESLLLTYELHGSAYLRGGKENVNVGVIYTNDDYNFVMGYPMESGGFFTHKQFEAESNVVVLNKNLSYQLFGSFDATGSEITMDGTRFHVVGVMNDGEEEKALAYLPVHLAHRKPNSLIVKIETENGITPEYIEAIMLQFMVAKPDYSFTHTI